MFYDNAKIYVRSGDGGDGHISFRREKFVPLGGPDGGSGGKGADIVFTVNPHQNSLVRFHRQVHFRAENGVNGGRHNMTGASGKRMILEVPPGTVIRDAETNEILADLTEPDHEAVLLAGGRGGRGNGVFATSINKAPRIAERGEPGEEKWLILELKLIADVGIIGVPNAGKSTLLSVVSGARPKIASYPFTTLQPSLGVVQLDGDNAMVLADIPGLIEGAAAGVGLGHAFLRHVERTRVLVHLLDGGGKDPLEDWAMINQELALYDVDLASRPQLVVLNKMDLPDAIAWEPLIAERMAVEGIPYCAISAASHQGIREMLGQLRELLANAPRPRRKTAELIVIGPEEDENAFAITREADGFRVRGKRIERIAAMTYWEFEATVLRFQQILEGAGISGALRDAGVEPGDTVHIGDEVLEWEDG